MKKLKLFVIVCLLLMASTGYSWDEGTGTGTVTVVDALDSTSATSALSANQGKVLNDGKAASYGTLTNGKWCTTNGTTVACTQDTPAPAAGSTSLVTYGPTAVQTASCVANALTFTPTAAYGFINATITQPDAANCAVTMEETGAVEGARVVIYNASDAAAKTLTFTTTAGKILLIQGSPFVMAITESLELQYKSNQWVEVARSSGTFGLASLTLGGIILGDSTPDAAGELGYDSNVMKYYDNVGSKTLATTADLTAGSLDWVTTGTISGRLKTVVYSADGTLNVTTAQAQAGTFFINTYAGTQLMTLPAAGAGMAVCLKNGQGNARALQVHSDATDYIVMSTGARTSASTDYYQAAAASATNQICLVAFDDTDWHVTSERGTWAEE
jgi:hypothetical protein